MSPALYLLFCYSVFIQTNSKLHTIKTNANDTLTDVMMVVVLLLTVHTATHAQMHTANKQQNTKSISIFDIKYEMCAECERKKKFVFGGRGWMESFVNLFSLSFVSGVGGMKNKKIVRMLRDGK